MKKGHTVDVVFTLVLFCVFAASVMMALLSGAGVYKGVAETMAQSYEERTCLQYISAKIRHYNGDGGVFLGTFGENEALVLSEDIDGDLYNTYIYYYEGKVKELFADAELEFYPEDGFDIIEAQGISFEQTASNLIRIECTGASGNSAELLVNLRGAESEAAA